MPGKTRKATRPGLRISSIFGMDFEAFIKSLTPQEQAELLGKLMTGSQQGGGGTTDSSGSDPFAQGVFGPGAAAFFADPYSQKMPDVELPPASSEVFIYSVRIELLESEPVIWRRLLVRSDMTLAQLSRAVLKAMGWMDSHLHRFYAPNMAHDSRMGWFFVTEFDREEGHQGFAEADVQLSQVLLKLGDFLDYEYDFGDGWVHRISLKDIRLEDDHLSHAICVQGERSCPQEDSGGVHQWNIIAAALAKDSDPRNLTGELEQYANWLDPDVDPAHFDFETANEMLANEHFSPSGTVDFAYREETAGPDLVELVKGMPFGVPFELGEVLAKAVAAEPTPVESELAKIVEPWRRFLQFVAEEPVELTEAGWIRPATVRRIFDHLGMNDRVIRYPSREVYVAEVSVPRKLMQKMGLLAKRKGELKITRKGRAALADDAYLIRAYAQSILSDYKRQDERHGLIITLLCVLAAAEADPAWIEPYPHDFALAKQVASVMTAIGWSLEGRALKPSDVLEVSQVLEHLGLAMGFWEDGPVASLETAKYLVKVALWPGAAGLGRGSGHRQ